MIWLYVFQLLNNPIALINTKELDVLVSHKTQKNPYIFL